MGTKFETRGFGYGYKNGKLYHFDNRHVLVMRGWPHPLAWLKRRSHDWRPDRKFSSKIMEDELFGMSLDDLLLKLLHGYMRHLRDKRQHSLTVQDVLRLQLRDYQAINSFCSSIPEEIIKEVLRYRSRRWHILCLFARCPGALDLSVSNPALAYALASNWAFHQPKPTKPMRAARNLVFRKQKEILEWLGFPGTESMRRMFRKIPPDSLTVESLLLLRSVVKNEEARRMLAHLPAITSCIIKLTAVKKIRPYLTDNFFRNLLATGESELAGQLRDFYFLLLDTVRLLGTVQGYQLSAPFRSIAEVKNTYDELATIQVRQNQHKYNLMRFPSPPYEGSGNIVPITTTGQLYEEGLTQRNCCFGYAEKVADGDHYFYRVLSPVRATMLIKRETNRWFLQEIQKAGNEPVPSEIQDEILRDIFSSPVP